MKAIAKFVIGLALVTSVAAANAQKVQKPFEITIGVNFWTGDLETVGGDSGWVAGLDYYMSQNYGSNSMSFIGVRGWFDTITGTDVSAYGIHYGWRFAFSQGRGMNDPMANLYAKVALGYYGHDIEGAPDVEWGLGWFAGIGYTFQGNASIEVGYQAAPDSSGFDNRSWYATVGFRV